MSSSTQLLCLCLASSARQRQKSSQQGQANASRHRECCRAVLWEIDRSELYPTPFHAKDGYGGAGFFSSIMLGRHRSDFTPDTWSTLLTPSQRMGKGLWDLSGTTEAQTAPMNMRAPLSTHLRPKPWRLPAALSFCLPCPVLCTLSALLCELCPLLSVVSPLVSNLRPKAPPSLNVKRAVQRTKTRTPPLHNGQSATWRQRIDKRQSVSVHILANGLHEWSPHQNQNRTFCLT